MGTLVVQQPTKKKRTQLEYDPELLKKAQGILGTTGIKDTVDAALDEVVRAELRRRFAKRLSTMDGTELDNAEVMAGVWCQ